MENLSLHVLDIAENSVRAGAKTIEIELKNDPEKDLLTIRIRDDGKGMSDQEIKNALDPFYTTKENKRFGLGLSLFEQACRDTGGSFRITSEKNTGTEVLATLKPRHPDMKPVGEMLETMAVLIAGQPAIRFVYTHSDGAIKEYFDSGVPESV